TTDFLTQLPNRRQFMVALDDALLRQKRSGRAAALVMCDLDYFKHINDCFGHATGDLVLQHFSEILRDELRHFDAVGRVGGEEFALVLTGANASAAQAFAERVRARVASTPLMLEAKSGQLPQAISITVSIGITLIRDTDSSADICLSRSDAALYRAKTGGRDRVEMG
ncbi:MAG: GGDEF domain-containing protein, partial [Herbaspirillum sp.]